MPLNIVAISIQYSEVQGLHSPQFRWQRFRGWLLLVMCNTALVLEPGDNWTQSALCFTTCAVFRLLRHSSPLALYFTTPKSPFRNLPPSLAWADSAMWSGRTLELMPGCDTLAGLLNSAQQVLPPIGWGAKPQSCAPSCCYLPTVLQ